MSLVEQIIGFCEGDAAGEDIEAARDFLRTSGATERDVARMMLAMRGMHVPHADASLAEVTAHALNPVPRGLQCEDEGCEHYGTPHTCVTRVSTPVTDVALIDKHREAFALHVARGLDEFTRATGLHVVDLYSAITTNWDKENPSVVESNNLAAFSVGLRITLPRGSATIKV